MKAILTLIFVIIFGAMALAQNIESHVKVQGTEMGVVLDNRTDTLSIEKEIKTVQENQVGRLYKFRNARVKKALAFKTKRNKAKMA